MQQLDDAPEPEEPKADGNLSPTAWRDLLFPVSERGEPHRDSWKHGAAAALHGWDLHRHHTGQEMQLSRADYDQALTAAMTMVAVEGQPGAFSYVPHAAALSDSLKEKSQ